MGICVSCNNLFTKHNKKEIELVIADYNIEDSLINEFENFNGEKRIEKIIKYYDDNKKFSLNNYIGSGSFGDVYTIFDETDKKTYAVKIFKSTQINNIKNEIKILNHLGKHKHILNIINIQPKYFVMDYCQLGDMCDYIIKNGPPIDSLFKKWSSQLISIVYFFNQKNIEHRDIRPENILLYKCPDKTIEIKVIDWSFAKIITNNFYCNKCYSNLKLCRCYGAYRCLPLRALKATNCFPTRFLNYNIISTIIDNDPLVDIYSLGIALYIMKLGYHPFERYGKIKSKQMCLNLVNWYSNKIINLGFDTTSCKIITTRSPFDLNNWRNNHEMMNLIFGMMCPYKKFNWMNNKFSNRPTINEIVHIGKTFLPIELH